MKKTLLIIVALLVLGGVTVAAGMGLVNIPVLTPALGGSVKDLGVKIDPNAFSEITEKYNIDVQGDYAEYCISCDNIAYAEPAELTGDVNSDELSSLIQSVNNTNGVLKDVHVRLGDNNQGEMAAELDLTSFGVDVKVPVHVRGGFSVAGNEIAIDISSAKAGLFSVPSDYITAGEAYLSGAINDQLGRMPDLRIDELSVDGGQLNYSGVFPRVISPK